MPRDPVKVNPKRSLRFLLQSVKHFPKGRAPESVYTKKRSPLLRSKLTKISREGQRDVEAGKELHQKYQRQRGTAGDYPERSPNPLRSRAESRKERRGVSGD
ncbi:hypothetical protein TNCV_821551 [Trichonephila clavipes]|nr:hypothetical protein TNCV_821551 [Trichonephila clavipes]